MTHTTLNQLNAVLSSASKIDHQTIGYLWGKELAFNLVLVPNRLPYLFVTNITKSKNREASDKEPATEIK